MPTASRPRLSARSARAFSLIEMVVVLGILALLIGLLIPTVSRARENANRTRCAANLHAIGGACMQFAMEHDGLFPMAYQNIGASPTVYYRFPLVLSEYSALTANDAWKVAGTPTQMWTPVGAPQQVWACPSAVLPPTEFDAETWGPVLSVNYMYVGGMHYGGNVASNIGRSYANWKQVPPAVTVNDTRVSEAVLAADAVFYSGGSSYKWDSTRRYIINHPKSRDSTRPAYQNILYGDGHVEGKGESYYPAALNTYNNYSFIHGIPLGGFCYWGRYPGGAVADPPAPPAPPAPPTPPPPPAPPAPPPPPPPPPPPHPDPLPI